MTAKEVLEIIKNMNVEEKWKLLEMMYNEYYNTRAKRGEKSA
ncbi:hypothetical protein [Geobacillus phage GR1]|nr:hypothetical protein [Geobacillus phage GR1]